jgi:hypothetical protein
VYSFGGLVHEQQQQRTCFIFDGHTKTTDLFPDPMRAWTAHPMREQSRDGRGRVGQGVGAREVGAGLGRRSLRWGCIRLFFVCVSSEGEGVILK